MSRILFAAKQSQTQLDGIAHEQTIICRQLFAAHVVGSRPMKRKKNLLRMIIKYISFTLYQGRLARCAFSFPLSFETQSASKVQWPIGCTWVNRVPLFTNVRRFREESRSLKTIKPLFPLVYIWEEHIFPSPTSWKSSSSPSEQPFLRSVEYSLIGLLNQSRRVS